MAEQTLVVEIRHGGCALVLAVTGEHVMEGSGDRGAELRSFLNDTVSGTPSVALTAGEN